MQTIGYPNFDKKIIPNVVLTGAITEFDRGLETRGKNTDFGADTKSISWGAIAGRAEHSATATATTTDASSR